MSENQTEKIDSISGDEIKHKSSGDASRPKNSQMAVRTQPRPHRPSAQKEPEKAKTTHNRHTIEIIAVAIVLAVIIAGGLWWLYKVSPEDESEMDTELYSEEQSIDPIMNLLTQFGTIKMTGTLGAVPTTFEMNFNTEEGQRYYSSTPLARYVVKLRHADINADENYHIVLTDYLEGRVAIGRFDGILSSDGTVFTGKYVSSHGKVREFTFEK